MGFKKTGSITTEVAMACVAFLVLGLTLLLFVTKDNNPVFNFSFAASLEHWKNPISNFTTAVIAPSTSPVVEVQEQLDPDIEANSFAASTDDHGAVGKLLISALREATARAAAAGSEVGDLEEKNIAAAATYSSITDEEVEAWRRRNPCRSRGELEQKYKRRKFVKHLPRNRLWQRVFAEYENLHRTCMRKVLREKNDNNITAMFDFFSDNDNNNNSSSSEFLGAAAGATGCKFVVADAQDFGLGNRMTAVASSFLYAVLTQRVILVPDKVVIPDIVCEPFVGSSWRIAADSVRKQAELWTSSDQVWATMMAMNETTREQEDDDKNNIIVSSKFLGVRVDPEKQWRPDDRFWCDAEQEYLATQATWVYFKGCFYTVPKMFAVPRFRPVLEELFPDRMVLTHLLHSLMLPADVVWNRVKQVDNVFLTHADRRVGVQIRYRGGPSHFKKNHDMANTHVLQCAIQNGFLPNPYVDSSTTAATTDGNSTTGNLSTTGSSIAVAQQETIMVFATSLFRGLHDFLTQIYVRRPPHDKNTAAVGVLQLTHEGGQASGLEVDSQALAEMILLSFSDHLLVTPFSTFGNLAQGYGALRPWLVDIRADSTQACKLARSAEVCMQYATQTIDCPSEPRDDKRLIWDVIPYVSNCSTLEGWGEGVQLLNPNFS